MSEDVRELKQLVKELHGELCGTKLKDLGVDTCRRAKLNTALSAFAVAAFGLAFLLIVYN